MPNTADWLGRRPKFGIDCNLIILPPAAYLQNVIQLAEASNEAVVDRRLTHVKSGIPLHRALR